MAADVRVVWDEAAVKLYAAEGAEPQARLDEASALVVSAMKKNCPVSPVGALHESGNLRRSIHAFRLPDGSVIAGPTAEYAGYVIEGTEPHEIRSKGPWPLRNRETGQVFGPVVHHPGTAANHFVTDSLAEVSGATLGGEL